MDDLQQALLSPTGPVMLEALCLQTARRVAKLRAFLTPDRSYRLFAEQSLMALLLDRYEQEISQTDEYRRAELVSGILPISGAMEALSASRWLPGVRRGAGGRRDRPPRKLEAAP